MCYDKTIICLANSRKPPSGRCIAGLEVTDNGFGEWIRPVSARETREISEEERRYENGRDPRVLDVISIRFRAPHPYRYQNENHVIDDKFYWLKKNVLSWDDIQPAIETLDHPLWLNGYSSTCGKNDRVPDEKVDALSRSLYLVKPDKLKIVVKSEGEDYGDPRKRVRARFSLSGDSYLLAVTDPVAERHFLSKEEGEYPLDEALVCISLGELYHGCAYKLVAAVITPNVARR